MKMPRSQGQGPSRRDPPASDEHIAAEIVIFLADDPHRLSTFVEETGLDPRRLRDAVTDGSLHGGLFDYILSDESRLIVFAAHIGRDPEPVARMLSKRRQTAAGID